MAKRIVIGDWVFGRQNSWEYIGFVLAKDKSQVRIHMTQVYDCEVGIKLNVNKLKNKTITAQVSNVSTLEDLHVDDIMELIDMALDSNSKRDFNRLIKYLEVVKDNKDVPKKLWKVKRHVRRV